MVKLMDSLLKRSTAIIDDIDCPGNKAELGLLFVDMDIMDAVIGQIMAIWVGNLGVTAVDTALSVFGYTIIIHFFMTFLKHECSERDTSRSH